MAFTAKMKKRYVIERLKTLLNDSPRQKETGSEKKRGQISIKRNFSAESASLNTLRERKEMSCGRVRATE